VGLYTPLGLAAKATSAIRAKPRHLIELSRSLDTRFKIRRANPSPLEFNELLHL
jgi:hypothetical protein